MFGAVRSALKDMAMGGWVLCHLGRSTEQDKCFTVLSHVSAVLVWKKVIGILRHESNIEKHQKKRTSKFVTPIL